jgi:large subunit ribosomal protein L6
VSRKGKLPIALPSGVEVGVTNEIVTVTGPKGTLTLKIEAGVDVTREGAILRVSVKDTSRDMSRLHGLYYSLIQNMVIGTSVGFEKKLEMIGVGYRAAVQGSVIDVQVGYSHPTKLDIPHGLHVKVEKNTQISVTGIDKQAVGQFAAEIRGKRPPEPYQGKGIRYVGEFVRRKAGKAAKTAKKAA